MRSKKYLYALLIILCVSISNGYAQSDTLKVLFVGNSYTYFWNLPQTVEAISASQEGIYIKARQSTAGGTTWKQHWEGDKKLESRELIQNGNWNVVVLQNHSMSTIDNLDQFMEYGARFIDLVKKSGAKPVLYMTWAREYNPLMQSDIEDGYQALAAQHQIDVVPVGNIWKMVREQRPDLNLFDPDGSHPSPIGTYLTACAFYSHLAGQPASGLPERVKSTDANGEVLYLSIMSKENAGFIQSAIDEFLKKKKR